MTTEILASTSYQPSRLNMSSTTSQTAALLAAAKLGNEASLGRLLEMYTAYLKLLARVQIGRRLQGKLDASDLVQDTFVAAHRSFGLFRGQSEAEFTAWLVTGEQTGTRIDLTRELGLRHGETIRCIPRFANQRLRVELARLWIFHHAITNLIAAVTRCHGHTPVSHHNEKARRARKLPSAPALR